MSTLIFIESLRVFIVVVESEDDILSKLRVCVCVLAGWMDMLLLLLWRLEGEEQQESHHQTEKSHGF